MQFGEAIIQYNISLCLSGSIQSQGILYAYRAAAYLGLDLYRDCLDSARLAKECLLHFNVLQRVREFERIAINMMESEAVNYNKESTKLSYRRHKRISSFVHCLSPKDPRDTGAGLITTKNLLPGDVLIIEPSLLTLNSSKNMCTNCQRQCGSLKKCKCLYLFCSPECKAEAFAKYHNYECPLIEHLECFSFMLRVAFRSFFKIIQCFKDVNSLQEYLEYPPNPFDIEDFEECPERDTFASNFRVFYTKRGQLTMAENDFQELYAHIALVIDILKNAKEIPLAAETADDWAYLSELLMLHIIQVNWTGKSVVNSRFRYARDANDDEEMIADCVKNGSIAINGNASLISSSSSLKPNVVMDYVNNVLIVRALMCIPRGTELLCSEE